MDKIKIALKKQKNPRKIQNLPHFFSSNIKQKSPQKNDNKNSPNLA
jgi:hypothetical protein